MAFTYDPTLADPLSQVRFLIQDTVEAGADFSDEEITFFLTRYENDINKVAADLAYGLYVKYSKQADIEQVGKIRLEYVNRATAMKRLYESLKKQAALGSKQGLIFFGGIDKTQYQTTRDDPTTTKPLFRKDGIFFDPCYPDKWDDLNDCKLP